MNKKGDRTQKTGDSTKTIVKGVSPSVRQSVRKLQMVTRAITGLRPQHALDVLGAMPKSAAGSMQKTIRQAIANATKNRGFSEQAIGNMNIELMEGPTMKRFRFGGRGRIKPVLKRTSRIVVKLVVKEGA